MTAHTVGYHEGLLLPEPYSIPAPPAGPAAAIGTTVAKALETYGRTGESEGETRLFIHGEDFEWLHISKLLTCFSFPREITLAMHVAFGGLANVMKAYRAAVEGRYRWNAYGDSFLIV